MTFSESVKNELCSLPLGSDCDVLAEALGVLLFARVFDSHELRITTNIQSFGSRLPALFKRAFNVDIRKSERSDDGAMFIYSVTERSEMVKVYNALALEIDTVKGVSVNRALIEEDCCKSAFLRGAFLSGGSLTNPDNSYHLELVTSHYNLSREITALLLDMDLKPGVVVRKSNYVVYLKYSEGVEDFLTITGAVKSALDIMTVKVEKEVRNRVNRRVNCETANITKTVGASAIQISAINKLSTHGMLESLPSVFKDAAYARLANPEMSLANLSASMKPHVGKATLNYRLTKLVQLANELEEAPRD